jgi:hypothetical protein
MNKESYTLIILYHPRIQEAVAVNERRKPKRRFRLGSGLLIDVTDQIHNGTPKRVRTGFFAFPPPVVNHQLTA